MVDYYAILQVPADAEPAVIEAAYERLRRAYDPAALTDVSAELRELAGQRLLALEQARAILADPTLRAAYDAGLESVVAKGLPTVEPVLDYAPLPPARAAERARGFETEPIARTSPAPTHNTTLILAILLPLLIVASAFFLTDGGTKVAPKNDTPPVETVNSQLDQFEAAIATAKLATDADPKNVTAWIDYGNMLYNSVQIVREMSPGSQTYIDRIERWQMAATAYEKAMTIDPTNNVVAADHGAALCFYGNDVGDKKSANAGLQQMRTVVDQVPATDASRVLMNLGYCLAMNTPPQPEAAIAAWQRVIDREAKDSPIALQAAKLINQFR
ncbi:MAG: hypothetical protein RLZZ297_1416 [Chloroflexota bacterium]|jgi:tetratricopeptide (TPR) repeat protein